MPARVGGHRLGDSLERCALVNVSLERLGFVLLFAGLVGLVHGTVRADSYPSWPVPWVWALMAAVAAVFQLVAVLIDDHALRGVALVVAFGVLAARGFGYLIAPSDRVGFNGAAVGAYVVSVGAFALIGARWKDEGRVR